MQQFAQNTGVAFSLVLAADVANNGTVTPAYPAGTTQQSFDTGLAGAASYVTVERNDKYNVSDSKVTFAFGASTITITNTSGVTWKAGQRLDVFLDQMDGSDVFVVAYPLPLLVDITAADIATDMRPGIDGTLEYYEFVTMKPVTTGSKLATINAFIDGVAVTGGTIALTSAAATPMGKTIPCAGITAANKITKASKLKFTASAVTAFAEGSGYLVCRFRRI